MGSNPILRGRWDRPVARKIGMATSCRMGFHPIRSQGLNRPRLSETVGAGNGLISCPRRGANGTVGRARRAVLGGTRKKDRNRPAMTRAETEPGGNPHRLEQTGG